MKHVVISPAASAAAFATELVWLAETLDAGLLAGPERAAVTTAAQELLDRLGAARERYCGHIVAGRVCAAPTVAIYTDDPVRQETYPVCADCARRLPPSRLARLAVVEPALDPQTPTIGVSEFGEARRWAAAASPQINAVLRRLAARQPGRVCPVCLGLTVDRAGRCVACRPAAWRVWRRASSARLANLIRRAAWFREG